MPSKTANLAILFADISGSTQIYENLGDVTGRHTVCECLNIMSHVIKRNNGAVVKTIGDEIMCTFPSAEEGATAACEMHKQLCSDITGQAPEMNALSIRVGLHYGSVILEGRDVHGNAVIVASSMACLAKADQIITTQDTVDQLSEDMRFQTRLIDRSTIRGMKDAMDIYELNWQSDITAMSINVMIQEQNEALMRLTYKGKQVVLNEKQPLVVLGRSSRCDLPVDESLASREHLKLECRRGKFFITDQSTNGTYITMYGQEEAFLRREESLINGKGEISLGRPFVMSPENLISYTIEEG